MLAMQYRFPLPADYAMEVIRTRIRERGHLLNGFPHLEWKAYLWSEKSPTTPASLNSYAPFYLWQDNAGLNDFLAGPGFDALCADFGRPDIDLWSVWDYLGGQNMPAAALLCRQILPIAPGQALDELRRCEREQAEAQSGQGALAVVTAYDPQRWRLLRLSAWASTPQTLPSGAWEYYRVGYVAQGKPGAAE